MIKKPTFLIVGAAKSGTVALFNYLRQHPQVTMPVKESGFFCPSQCPDKTLTEKKYFSMFCKDPVAEAGGEAGTIYLYNYEEAVPRIRQSLGDVKIIMILRSPVERAFSAYNHFRRDNLETLSFLEALKKGKKRSVEKNNFFYDYVGVGLYSRQVETYLNAFSQVKVLFYDDLTTRPADLMKDLYRFIGVRDDFHPDTGVRYNVSGTPKNQFLQKILVFLLFKPSLFKKIVKPVMTPFLTPVEKFLNKIQASNMRKNALTPAQRETAFAYFQSDIERLEKILGRDLSVWKSQGPADIGVSDKNHV